MSMPMLDMLGRTGLSYLNLFPAGQQPPLRENKDVLVLLGLDLVHYHSDRLGGEASQWKAERLPVSLEGGDVLGLQLGSME